MSEKNVIALSNCNSGNWIATSVEYIDAMCPTLQHATTYLGLITKEYNK